MLRVEIVKCSKCGKMFRKAKGGFVKGITDDCDVCLACKTKRIKSIFRK